jgi:hypothetical protein
MRDTQDPAFRHVEETQETLKRNIEESTRLIGQAQDAIERHRETRKRDVEVA